MASHPQCWPDGYTRGTLESFVLDLVEDPMNRGLTKRNVAYENARQSEDQTFQAFAAELESR